MENKITDGDNIVDNCGILVPASGKTSTAIIISMNLLWITVDRLWMKISKLTRENSCLSLFHRPITVNRSFCLQLNGGTE